jgi:transcriptional regulator with XRE-family HTH domain
MAVALLPQCMVVPWAMQSDMRVPTGDMLAAARRLVGLRQTELAKAAGIDSATLSRMEGTGNKPVKALSQNLEAVLDALRRAGVEIEDDGIKFTKRRR